MREINLNDEQQNLPMIGPYLVTGRIAQGRGSEVLRGRTEDNKVVALKLLNPNFFDDESAEARFRTEFEHLQRIDHPHVAKVLDFGKTDEGRPYLAMENIQGVTLRKLIEDKVRLPLPQILLFMIQACEGLRAALAQNVIHRDITPGNLMLDNKTHEVKIVDFGLSKTLWAEPGQVNVEEEAHAIGTPRYMSPEHVRGHSLDHRSDLYSLGASFYHLLAGRPPFDAPTDTALMELIRTQRAVPLQEINPDLSQDLCTIISALLEPDPNDRFEDYPTVIAALDATRLAEKARLDQTHHAEPGQDLQNTPPSEANAAPQDTQPSPNTTDESGFGYNTGHIPAHSAPEQSTQTSSAPRKPITGEELRKYGDERTRQGSKMPLIIAMVLLVLVLAGGVWRWVVPPSRDGGFIGSMRATVNRFLLPTQGKPDPQLERLKMNHERMRRVGRAAIQYETTMGTLPESVDALVSNGYIDAAEAEDIWGGRFLIFGYRNLIVSSGPDHIEESSDDWIFDLSGNIRSAPPELQEALAKSETVE